MKNLLWSSQYVWTPKEFEHLLINVPALKMLHRNRPHLFSFLQLRRVTTPVVSPKGLSPAAFSPAEGAAMAERKVFDRECMLTMCRLVRFGGGEKQKDKQLLDGRIYGDNGRSYECGKIFYSTDKSRKTDCDFRGLQM